MPTDPNATPPIIAHGALGALALLLPYAAGLTRAFFKQRAQASKALVEQEVMQRETLKALHKRFDEEVARGRERDEKIASLERELARMDGREEERSRPIDDPNAVPRYVGPRRPPGTRARPLTYRDPDKS